MINVSPDQLGAAAGYITHQYGSYGYSVEGIESYSHAVTLFYVKHLDGSRFVIAVDKWGNVGGPLDSRGYYLPDCEEDAKLKALVEEMHAKAVAS